MEMTQLAGSSQSNRDKPWEAIKRLYVALPGRCEQAGREKGKMGRHVASCIWKRERRPGDR